MAKRKMKKTKKKVSQGRSLGRVRGASAPKVASRYKGKGSKSGKVSSLKSAPEQANFPIAAIGASAGGLQALRDLLSSLPVDTGMAFVIIQHLDPTHGSMSADILSRSTKMPVIEVKEGMPVRPNHVYVIPPNCNLDLSGGGFKILPRFETRGQHMPLDFFFRRLSEYRKSQAIGVVLSGTACDGTQGLLAIKNQGGIALVQDPQTAKFDGMPRSAIASGAVDLICPPQGLAAELARIAKHSYVVLPEGEREQNLPKGTTSENLAKIFSLLRAQAGVNFAQYKNSTIQRRLARRTLLCKIEDLAEYAVYLENNPIEVKDLFSDLIINVTSFFRDQNVFEVLKNTVLPKYMKGRDPSVPFRLWVAGCSTGEEVYSLVISLMEFQREAKIRMPLQVFASDISEQILHKARLGVYPESISEDVSRERLETFFERVEGGGYKIAKSVRDICLFSRHDVTRDPPFAKVDMISCRNVLIYFATELQKTVLPIFHYALNPSGILLLGRSESTGGFSELFMATDKTNKIYQKRNIAKTLKLSMSLLRPRSAEQFEPAICRIEPGSARVDLQRESDRIALIKYAPPSVVISEALEIIQSRGRTAPFLELSPGHASLNLLRMAHPELSAKLKNAIQRSRTKNGPVTQTDLQIHDEGSIRTLSIHVVPIPALPVVKERFFTIFLKRQIRKEGNQLEGSIKPVLRLLKRGGEIRI
ncbi:MAG: hypothetical protein IPL83_05050 [Bdellovibrionales bacterium]|nr:hypothetical protein [Bdellovibrionales bacterium]